MQDRAELIYKTNKREPLGQTYCRDHVLPQETQEPEFPGFGKKVEQGTVDAKEVIFPRGVGPDPPEIRAQYLYTHQNYDPGEQVNRNYNLPDEIKTQGNNFMYGKEDPLSITDGVARCFRADRNEDKSFPNTVIGKVELEDYRNSTAAALSKGSNYMQGAPKVPEGHFFGKPSGKSGPNETVAACLEGATEAKDLIPDSGLGTFFICLAIWWIFQILMKFLIDFCRF